jgi:hypothetical protein
MEDTKKKEKETEREDRKSGRKESGTISRVTELLTNLKSHWLYLKKTREHYISKNSTTWQILSLFFHCLY